MDIEAKKKYCGLLMFDAPSVSNSSSSQSTRGVDSTFYDSSMNTTSSMFIQETFNEYAEPQSRALAAGAALGDAHDSSDGKSSNDDKSQPPKRTPRPPNAFILYRQAKQPGIIASIKNPTNAQVSRQISEMWKNESEETRLYWERVADRKKLEHMQAHPDYVYRPNKNRNKIDKRRTRPRSASKDQNSTATAAKKSRSRVPLVNLSSQVNEQLGHIVPSSSHSLVTPPVSQPSTPVQIRQQHQYPIIQSQMPLLAAQQNMNDMIAKQQFIPLNSMNPQLSSNTPLTPPQEMLTLQGFKNRYYQSVVPEEEGGKHGSGFAHYPGNNPITSYEDLAIFNPMFVPDVARQQEQFNSELMLHHPQPEPCTPTSNDSSSASNSPTLQSADQQYYLQPSVGTVGTGNYFHDLLNNPYELFVEYAQMNN